MKIDPNAPAYPGAVYNANDKTFGSVSWPGMPIRLAIAAQIMASANGRGKLPAADEALIALEWADALIAAHNKERS